MGPFEIAILATMITGTAMSAVNQYRMAQAQNRQAALKKRIAQRNAKVARMEGDYAEKVAREEERDHRQKVKQIIGSQKAAMAANGFIVDEGTNLDILEDTAAQGEVDALAILNEGTLAKWRAEEQANISTLQGDIYGSDTANPALSAGGTFLTGLGQTGLAYSRFSKGNKKGS